ncbi:unnamed protein product, partial [marine sediment metagenome]
ARKTPAEVGKAQFQPLIGTTEPMPVGIGGIPVKAGSIIPVGGVTAPSAARPIHNIIQLQVKVA